MAREETAGAHRWPLRRYPLNSKNLQVRWNRAQAMNTRCRGPPNHQKAMIDVDAELVRKKMPSGDLQITRVPRGAGGESAVPWRGQEKMESACARVHLGVAAA